MIQQVGRIRKDLSPKPLCPLMEAIEKFLSKLQVDNKMIVKEVF